MRVQSGGVQRRRHLVWDTRPRIRLPVAFPVHRWRWERTLKRSVGRPRSPWPPAQTAPVERSGGPSPCPVALHRARRHRHAPTPAPAIQPHEARRPRQRNRSGTAPPGTDRGDPASALLQAFQQQARIVAAAIHQDQGELVAAQPRDRVGGAQMPAQRGGEVNQLRRRRPDGRAGR